MPKSKKSKSKPQKWYMRLDQDDVDAAFEEATTDAYGLEEQHTSLFQAITDELEFPWLASVLGETNPFIALRIADNFHLTNRFRSLPCQLDAMNDGATLGVLLYVVCTRVGMNARSWRST